MFIPIWATPTAAGVIIADNTAATLCATLEQAQQKCVAIAASNPSKHQYTFYILDTDKRQIVKSAALPPPINLAWE